MAENVHSYTNGKNDQTVNQDDDDTDWEYEYDETETEVYRQPLMSSL